MPKIAAKREDAPFWERKSLEEMTLDEWESLCDGCGRCCLHKLEDIDTGELSYTEVACELLDVGACRCKNYVERTLLISDCVEITPQVIKTAKWLPPTCAYRLLQEGKPLRWWHPLVSGRPETVVEAGIAVSGRAVAEHDAGDFEDHIVEWPAEDPDELSKDGNG